MRSRTSEGDARSRVASEKTAALFTPRRARPTLGCPRGLDRDIGVTGVPGDLADPLIPPIRLLGHVDDDHMPGIYEAIHYRSACCGGIYEHGGEHTCASCDQPL